MPQTELNQSVGDIVAENLSRSRVFETFGIDYCCNGHLPLTEACQAQGVDPKNVIEAIAKSDAETKPEDSTDWRKKNLTELVDHIQATHHKYLNAEMPRLSGLMEKVVKAHSANHPDLVETAEVFAALVAELTQHMAKEEEILFPIIRQMEAAGQTASHCGSVANPINVMEQEHANAGQALATIQKLTNQYKVPEDACTTYQALLAGMAEMEVDLHQHIHKESSILFPRAIELEKKLSNG